MSSPVGTAEPVRLKFSRPSGTLILQRSPSDESLGYFRVVPLGPKHLRLQRTFFFQSSLINDLVRGFLLGHALTNQETESCFASKYAAG